MVDSLRNKETSVSASTAASSEAVAVAKAYFAAVNAAHLDDLAAVFAEGAVLQFPLWSPIRGRTAIRDFYAGVLGSYTEHHDVVTRWYSSPCGSVAAEIHYEGKTVAGHSVVFDAIDLFHIRKGKIEDLRIFFDSAKVLQMVGEEPR